MEQHVWDSTRGRKTENHEIDQINLRGPRKGRASHRTTHSAWVRGCIMIQKHENWEKNNAWIRTVTDSRYWSTYLLTVSFTSLSSIFKPFRWTVYHLILPQGAPLWVMIEIILYLFLKTYLIPLIIDYFFSRSSVNIWNCLESLYYHSTWRFTILRETPCRVIV
jgi:hypothetical protein